MAAELRQSLITDCKRTTRKHEGNPRQRCLPPGSEAGGEGQANYFLQPSPVPAAATRGRKGSTAAWARTPHPTPTQLLAVTASTPPRPLQRGSAPRKPLKSGPQAGLAIGCPRRARGHAWPLARRALPAGTRPAPRF